MKSGKSLLRLAWTLLAIAALVLVFTTLEESDKPFPEVRPDARYERLFPTYVELCAVSQIRAQFERRGTSFGHAVMYLGGACRSDDAPYPSLEVCGDERDRNPAEAGIGISVNRLLRNVNWIATPGSRLFFHGGLEPGERLDQARALETLSMVKARGVFSGVEVHGSYLPPDDDKAALVYLAAAEFLGTDFALNFGRSIFCARLPMPENVFQDVLDFLNAINREYAEGEADYRWSGYNDNCSHLLHNALAAARRLADLRDRTNRELGKGSVA
jgi:hypothetical protein